MNLSVKILISLVLSVVVGLMAGVDGLPFIKWWIAPVGTIFINLIKMVIVPIVFTSLVVGMTSLGDLKKNIEYLIGMERQSGSMDVITPLYVSRMLNVPLEDVEKVMKDMGA